MNKEITSRANPRIKELVQLKSPAEQKRQGRCLAEGKNIVLEALHNGTLETVLCLPEYVLPFLTAPEVIEINASVAEKLSDVRHNQGIFGVVQIKNTTLDLTQNILMLDDVQDPGNIGTLIRSAHAFGFTNIAMSPGSAWCYNDKIVRSSQGLVFAVNVVYCDLLALCDEAKSKGHIIAMTHLQSDATPYYNVALENSKVSLVLGNEGHGISAPLLAKSKTNIIIPMTSNTESLNVGVAGSILMAHFFHKQNEKK